MVGILLIETRLLKKIRKMDITMYQWLGVVKYQLPLTNPRFDDQNKHAKRIEVDNNDGEPGEFRKMNESSNTSHCSRMAVKRCCCIMVLDELVQYRHAHEKRAKRLSNERAEKLLNY